MFAKDRCDNEVKQRIPGFRITDDLTALWHLGSNSWSRSAAFEKNVGLRAVNRVQEGAGISKNDRRRTAESEEGAGYKGGNLPCRMKVVKEGKDQRQEVMTAVEKTNDGQ